MGMKNEDRKRRNDLAAKIVREEGVNWPQAQDKANRIINGERSLFPEDKGGFTIPRGKYKGRRINEMTDQELQMSYAGFNGSDSGQDIASILRKEIELRKNAGNPATQRPSAPVSADPGWPKIERRGNVTITYHSATYRQIEGADPVDYYPWPDGWGHPEHREQGEPPPFDCDDSLDAEFLAIVGA